MPDHCPLPQRGCELLAQGQLAGNHCFVLPGEKKGENQRKVSHSGLKLKGKHPFFDKYINGNSRGVDFHTIHSHTMSRPLSCSQHAHPHSSSIFNAKCFKLLSLLLLPVGPFQNQDKETEIKSGRIPTCNGNSYLKIKVKKKKVFYKVPSFAAAVLLSLNEHRPSSRNPMRSHFLQSFPRQEGIHAPAGSLAACRSLL